MAEVQGGEIVAEYGYLDGEPLVLWRDGDVPLPVSLLNNGGFESGKADWLSCADVGSTRIVTNRSEGAKAVRLKNADCLYQEFAVTPSKRYTLKCDAKGAQTKYTSIRLTIMNSEFTELRSSEKAITSSAYETYSGTVLAPGAGAIGAVTLYSEDTGFFDACSITEGS